MSGHEWCQDVPRDEAVRAAEDAAAGPSIQHRDLPEQVALLWASVSDILGRVVRLEGEMDAGEAEAEEATLGSGDVFADVGCGSTDDEVVRLTAERDFAAGEAERLRIRVAELEQQIKLDDRWAAAAPAANAGGGAKQEPVAWGVIMTPGSKVWRCSSEKQAQKCVDHFGKGTVVPLYAAPPEPRGWLTAEEREVVEQCLRHFVRQEVGFLERNDPGHRWLQVRRQQEATLTALLARSSPPRVRRPPRACTPHRDAEWIAAIREAGGEVEG